MPKKSLQRPFLVQDDEGNKFVATNVLMQDMVVFWEGLDVYRWDDDDRMFITVDDAIAFAGREMSVDPELYGKAIEVLKRFKQ